MKNQLVSAVRLLRPSPPLYYSQLPPFIMDPADPASAEFARDCLAHWLLTSKTADTLGKYLQTQKPETLEQLVPHLARCLAWHWLLNNPPAAIRQRLRGIAQPVREPLRMALNQLRPLCPQPSLEEFAP